MTYGMRIYYKRGIVQ